MVELSNMELPTDSKTFVLKKLKFFGVCELRKPG